MAIKVTRRLPPWVSRLLRSKALRRFVRHQEGAAAIEFAIVVAPFLAMVFAIMETALVFFAGQTLETAVADASRLIMTGQAQKAGFDQAKFKADICTRLVAMFDCSAGVKVDVRTYQSFAAADLGKPVDADGNLKNNFVYQPGCPDNIVVVRGMYEWPVFVSLFGLNLSDMPGGKRLLLATATFRNEPYGSTC